MAELVGLSCCGIVELADITGEKPETILKSVCQEWFDDTPRAYVVFSTVRGSPSGENLAAYLKEHELGRVYKMKPKMNPNTHHTLRVWCWAPNNPKLKSLAIKKGWYERDKEF